MPILDDLKVRFSADGTDRYNRDVDKMQRSNRGMDASIAAMSKRVAGFTAAVGIAGTAMLAASVKMARGATQAATEIQNLSRLAGTMPEQFQKLARAAETVGVEQEKLADIFKDVNDKFGDFVTTGAGPLKDFFETIAPQVGVTAEQFARLSGPEALQLYVTSLERAGVSQQQMTFFMEALASDATALVPLLRDNGAQLKTLGDEAERAGRILSNDMVRNGAAVEVELRKMAGTIRDNLNRAILENSDEILALAEDITETWIPALVSVAQFIGDVIGAVTRMVQAISDGITKIAEFGAAVVEHMQQPTVGSRNRKPGTGERPQAAPTFNAAGFAGDVPPPESPGSGPIVLDDVVVPPGAGTGAQGGGGSGPGREDFEALRRRFATQAEIIAEQRAMALEKLREFREAGLLTEQEFNQTEERIRAEHLDKMGQLERSAQRERLDSMRSVFSDLASLATSENARLFKIGQAAAVAEAVISGQAAAVSAWEKGMKVGGPVVAAAYAGASVLRTGAMISQMKSASPSGGGVGGAMGGAGAGAMGAGIAAAPQAQPVLFRVEGLDPGQLYKGETLTRLFDALQDEAGDRGFRFV